MTYPRYTPLAAALPSTVPFVGPETQEREAGKPFRARIGANENVFGPSPRAIAAMEAEAREIWKYGDAQSYDLRKALAEIPADASAEDIQTKVYEIGKAHEYENLRNWFKALYQILLGQEQGPRMGSFIALYGVQETIALIDRALAGEDLS